MPVDRLDRRREVDDGEPLDLPLGGEHDRPRPLGARRRDARVEDDGEPGAPPGRHADDVADRAASPATPRPARAAAPHRCGRARPRGRRARGAARRTPRSRRGGRSSPRGSPSSASSFLRTCWASPTTARSAWNCANDVSSIARAGVAPDLADQVDRHVVRRRERRAQRVGAGRREAGERPRVEPGVPQDDGVALDVDAAPARPAGQLGVLPRRDVGVRLAVPLDELLEHDRAGRHVDAERQRLGREHRLDQALRRTAPRRPP